MDKIAEIVLADPIKAVAVIAVALVLYFIKRDYQDREVQFKGFEDRLKSWDKSIYSHMRETRDTLIRHSDDMGKATKAVNGDMLKIKETVYELKHDVHEELISTKNLLAAVQRDTDMMTTRLEYAIKTFDDKYGRVIDFKRDLDLMIGKVTKLEESTGELQIKNIKHQENMSQVAQALNVQQSQIEQLKRK